MGKSSTSFKKGQHASPSTEFKKGRKSENKGKTFPKQSSKNHWNWKGGKKLHTDGYYLIRDYRYPSGIGSTYAMEHRLIMEKHIGRPLERKEVVHHINRNRLDNRIENLQLLANRGEHRRLHALENRKNNIHITSVQMSED